MKRDDYLAAVRLATTLIHKNMGELFKTAETDPSLVFQWLADLSVAQRSRNAESDLLTEAIDDVRAALRHSARNRDNVVPIRSTVACQTGTRSE